MKWFPIDHVSNILIILGFNKCFLDIIIQNNYPTAEYQDLIESMKTLHEMKMKNNVDDGSPEDELTMAEFEN